jgi:biotin carboxyl carrier protein
MEGVARLRVGDTVHEVEVLVRNGKQVIRVDGEEFQADGKVRLGVGTARVGDEVLPVHVEEWVPAGKIAAGAGGARQKVRSPMSGKLVELRVKEGASVAKGDVLFVLEAMKMQNEVRSPASGVVAKVSSKPGETMDAERVVLEIEAG